MEKEQVITGIREIGAVAVIRAQTEEEALRLVGQCVEGGIRAIELTFTVPFAHRVLEQVARAYGDAVLLGAGTVLDSETARVALLSGAEFIVSPCYRKEMIRLCNRYRKLSVCGVMTITEAVAAMEDGCDILKLFPADTLGVSFLKALKGPLPQAQVMPTGGISAANAGDWIRAGAMAVGASGSLLRGDVAQNARELLRQVRQAREAMV